MIKTTRLEPPTEKEVYDFIERLDSLRDKALFAILYLTGARISEVVRIMRKKDLDYDTSTDHVVVKLYTEKKRQGIEIGKVPFRKNEPVAHYIREYLQQFSSPDDLIFNISRQAAWYRVKKADSRYFNHLFRHSRLTELAQDRKVDGEYKRGMTDYQLKQFARWTDSRPASTYVTLRWQNLIGNV